MKGAVRLLNLQNGLAAVETNEGFAVIEVRERCALDISDVVSGPLASPGEQTLYNVTKREIFAVSVKHVRCSLAEVYGLLA